MAIMQTPAWHEFIRMMPKVELHLHLEGAVPYATLMSLINKYGGDSQVRSLADLKNRFAYKTFPQFIETWIWKNQFFRAPEDFELSTFETLTDLHLQHVEYLEAFYSPWDFADNGLSMPDITRAVLRACKRAREEHGIQCVLIADLNRDHGPERAMERIDEVVAFIDQGVIGIGLGGSEHLYPADLFEDAFAKAKRCGLHRVAHAGEAAGPESVWNALQKLDIERIGHGTRAWEDSLLIEELRRRKIPLEMCLTSNVCTGVVRSIEAHPLKKSLEAGLQVTLNTDDPTMFGCTLTSEYVLLLDKPGFTHEELRQISYNALESTFLDEAGKQRLRRRFDEAWKHAPSETSDR
jgi:adenosine deaminase